MSCRRFRKSLIEYVDGELSGERKDAVREHVDSCETCKAAVEKLEFSASALSSLDAVKMPEPSAQRIAAVLRTSADSARPALHSVTGRLGFFTSVRGLATTGVAAALIIGLAILVITFGGSGQVGQKGLATGSMPGSTTTPATAFSTSPGQQKTNPDLVPDGIATIMPAVKVTNTNYDDTALRNTFENLDIKKQIAANYTMAHAINYCDLYKRKMADMMVDAGQDGAMLEAMITYIESSEPVLLPYYAESANYTGVHVYIIGFAGPRRTAKSEKLTRTEVWVMNPAKFEASPDSSIVYFLEQK